MSDVAYLPATELLKLYRQRELSPVEATETALRQIELYNPRINAYCLVDAEQALAQARESEERYGRGRPKGRLERRKRRGGGYGHGTVERWNRRRRLDQDSGRFLRHSGPETHLWPGSPVAG